MDTYEQCLESYHAANRNSIYFLVESISFQQGLEGPYELIKHYSLRGKHQLACMYWNAVQNIPDDNFSFLIAYYVAISAKANHQVELTAQMCLKLFQYKEQMQLHMLDTIIQNVRFVLPYCRPTFLQAFQDFLLYVKNTHHIEPQYKPKRTNSILFYVGGNCPPWNYTHGLTNAGGSEQAIRYITQHFDCNVYVCGNVLEEQVGNVHYVKKERLAELIMNHHFQTIILSRDISFLELCPTHYTDSHLIMAHDVELYGVHNVHETLLKWNIPCVCLTPFHQQLFLQKYPSLKTHLIPNAIEPSLFPDKPKITNQFIFTSCSERGLDKLIQLWPSILLLKPDATLIISSYQPFPREHDLPLKQQIDLYPSIQHLGQLPPKQLYEHMATADYWLFPSTFLETSCITALEMMASKVKCLFYPIGGIVDTMHGYGIPIHEGHELDFQTYDLHEAQQYALSCTWKKSAALWTQLITHITENTQDLANTNEAEDIATDHPETVADNLDDTNDEDLATGDQDLATGDQADTLTDTSTGDQADTLTDTSTGDQAEDLATGDEADTLTDTSTGDQAEDLATNDQADTLTDTSTGDQAEDLADTHVILISPKDVQIDHNPDFTDDESDDEPS
jgi:glycosyltransferase involved in cell wall biosynthesis